jgi:hypothetical protein
MRKRWFGLVLGLSLALPAATRAQSWEAPAFFAPRRHDDIGLYLFDPEGGDLGLMGIWRQSGAINLGVRAGFGGVSGDRTVLVGAELYGLLVEPNADNVVAAAWLVAAGATFDGATWLRIPAGVSLGARLDAGGFAVTPYAYPRVSFDLVSVDVAGVEETDTEFNVDIDLGAEVQLDERFLLRGAFTIGDRNTVGFGLAYRIPRAVAVR